MRLSQVRFINPRTEVQVASMCRFLGESLVRLSDVDASFRIPMIKTIETTDRVERSGPVVREGEKRGSPL